MVITDVQIPFASLVVLIMKVVLASIPAFIILSLIFMLLGQMLGGVFAGPTRTP